MVAAYEEQALALIEGGVDILLIETAQDLLQVKIATIGVLEAMQQIGQAIARYRFKSRFRTNEERCSWARRSVPR